MRKFLVASILIAGCAPTHVDRGAPPTPKLHSNFVTERLDSEHYLIQFDKDGKRFTFIVADDDFTSNARAIAKVDEISIKGK
jgi:hypothetical protein